MIYEFRNLVLLSTWLSPKLPIYRYLCAPQKDLDLNAEYHEKASDLEESWRQPYERQLAEAIS
jgi:hypothetical protein